MPGEGLLAGSTRNRLARAGGHVPHGAPPQGGSLHPLQPLVAMRNVAIVGQALGVLLVDRALGVALPLGPMAAVIVALALFNAATWRTLRTGRAVSERELAVQLLVDLAALTLQLAMTGGAGNPFVGLLVLPVVVSAALLPSHFTWAFAAAALACHALLWVWARPLLAPADDARHVQWFTTGLWVSHAVVAGMVALFVARAFSGVRASEQARAALREQESRNEHVVRVGTLAAHAAHELAQPMATMSLLLSEMQPMAERDPELRDMVKQTTQQLANLRERVGALQGYGRSGFDTRTAVTPVADFVRRCLDVFAVRRPGMAARLVIDTAGPVPDIRHDLALRQSLLNLLANAADVSPQWIEVHVSWNADEATLAVHDRGPGIAPEVHRQLGKMFFTTKPAGAGNGLGLNLVHTAVARLGGSLQLGNAPEGGACARIVLPIVSPEPGSTNAAPPMRARRA